jgi:hypothetical protein
LKRRDKKKKREKETIRKGIERGKLEQKEGRK